MITSVGHILAWFKATKIKYSPISTAARGIVGTYIIAVIMIVRPKGKTLYCTVRIDPRGMEG